MAYLSYLVGEVAGLSGIVALFVSAIIISHYALHNISKQSRCAPEDPGAATTALACALVQCMAPPCSAKCSTGPLVRWLCPPLPLRETHHVQGFHYPLFHLSSQDHHCACLCDAELRVGGHHLHHLRHGRCGPRQVEGEGGKLSERWASTCSSVTFVKASFSRVLHRSAHRGAGTESLLAGGTTPPLPSTPRQGPRLLLPQPPSLLNLFSLRPPT